jgi:hypothetical protein
MTALAWDKTGERFYETGVEKGVLFLPDNSGDYNEGHAWNGLTTVTEKPTGADSHPQYADNIKYLNLIAAESFGATVEAFTYPDAFAQCDGTAEPQPGIYLGQQGRRVFGLSYRSRVGNDLAGTDLGYKIHLVYGCLAAPSDKAYATINDSPSAIAFSWDVSTTPVPVDGHKVIALVGTGVTNVNVALPSNQPAFNSGTGIITLPAVTGVVWSVNGEDVASGAQPALASGDTATVRARAADGYNLIGDDDWEFQQA